MNVAADGGASAGREEKLRRAVVRIVDRGLRVVGTGFFVAPDLVATCAHVVHEALQEKDKALRIEGGEKVEIQLLSGMPEGVEALPTTVERAYFRDKDAEDVALLRLQCPLPDGIQPLALATSEGTENRDVRGWAFPKVGRDGLWMTARVVGPLDDPRTGRRLQLRSTNISPGCSGGPLWDEQDRVVGMAVAIVDQEAKTGRHGDTAKAIAAEVVARVCRELAIERVDRRTTAWHVPFLRPPSFFTGREDPPAEGTTRVHLKRGVQLRTRTYFGFGVAAIAWLGLGTPTTGLHLRSISAPTWIMTALTLAFSVVVFAVDSLPGSDGKAVLVFWRRRHPLPGSRAFDKANLDGDTRIDRERLREVVGATLPRTPQEQNSIWYRLFKSVENDTMVQAMHSDYLLFRDLAWLSIVLAGLALANIVLWPPSAQLLGIGAGAFGLLYLLFRRAASERGHRFVNQVLVTVSVRPLCANVA